MAESYRQMVLPGCAMMLIGAVLILEFGSGTLPLGVVIGLMLSGAGIGWVVTRVYCHVTVGPDLGGEA